MIYRNLGNTDIKISAISLGTWAIGGDSNWGYSDDNESIATIHKAHDLGVNYIDTAPAYGLGHSEEVVGQALKNRRSDYVLATKCGLVWDTEIGSVQVVRDGYTLRRNLSSNSIKKQVEDSLNRLQTDYIDILITHWQSVAPFYVPVAETMETLNQLKQEGKIRTIGISNVSKDHVEEYMKNGEISLVQQKYSMLDRTYEKDILPVCENNNITFQAYSPLERGILTGKVLLETTVNGLAKQSIKWYSDENREKVIHFLNQIRPLSEKYQCSLASLIIAWTLAQSQHMNVLSGARKTSQVMDNASGGSLLLDDDDLEMINQTIKSMKLLDI